MIVIRRIIKIIIIIASLLLNIDVIKAEDYWVSKRRYDNIYGVFDGLDRIHLFYAQSYIINNEQAYCLEPGVAINTNYYSATEDLSLSGLNEDIIEKVKIIGYYGFNYPGHSENRYYMAAQELIWKAITGRDTYWVSEENIDGPRINIDNEKQNIMDLVNTHYTKPSFDSEEVSIQLGETYTLNDTNKVLSRYKILSSPINNVRINNNKITITPESVSDSGEIKLTSNLYTDKVSLLYFKDDNQKLISSTGGIESVTSSIRVRVIEKPYLKVIKVEDDTGRTVNLSGITFKIKNLDTGEYVCENSDCTYTTKSNGYFKTANKFDYGNYSLEEIDDKIDGYLWNSEPLLFKIDENSEIIRYADEPYLELKFKNKRVTGTIEINKVGEKLIYKDGVISYEDYPLTNVVFNLYAGEDIYTSNRHIIYHKDDFIGAYKTNNGKLVLNDLVLGKYYIKEIATVDNHILDSRRFDIDLIYKDQYTPNIKVTINIKNYLAKGVLEFTKIDSETGEFLPNTKVGIYNNKDELIYEGYTNENGKIILEGIPVGNYYIKELIPPEGYNLERESVYFEIKSNNEVVNTLMEDTIIKVPSTNQDNNYLIYIASGIIIIMGGIIFFHEKK